jgi:hypothetical protein
MMPTPTQSHVSPPSASPSPVCGAMTDGSVACGAGAMSSPGSGVLNGVGEATAEVGLASAVGDAAAVAVLEGSGVADSSWACVAVTVHIAASRVHAMARKTRVTLIPPSEAAPFGPLAAWRKGMCHVVAATARVGCSTGSAQCCKGHSTGPNGPLRAPLVPRRSSRRE